MIKPAPNYKYVGVPPTPAIIMELILELFAGKLVDRATIVREVANTHMKRGGANHTNITLSVKKALANLRDSKAVTSVSTGYWQIGTPGDAATTAPTVLDEQTPAAPAPEVPVKADAIIGEGSSSVYVYYLPTYREQAIQKGEKTWACKVGFTDGDPLTRVLTQASTALPENPRIAIILYTERARDWETAIHAILRIRGSHLTTVPGTEWFDTSPDEIMDIIRQVDPDIASALTPDNNKTHHSCHPS
jgi:hypothetical protein